MKENQVEVETIDESDEEEYEKGVVSEKWIKQYASSHKILLVGEGDFSFSLCLARAFGSAYNMISTSLDSLEMIEKKYREGIRNVKQLEERGCIILHGVDATNMSDHFFLSSHRFDRVVYNFPHVGFIFPEGSPCQIQLNKRLAKGFLKNAKLLLRKGGEIHVTHKEGDPYNQWDLVKKAAKLGLVLQERMPFRREDYPGYCNKRAHGTLSDSPFLLGDCTTFIFKLPPPS